METSFIENTLSDLDIIRQTWATRERQKTVSFLHQMHVEISRREAMLKEGAEIKERGRTVNVTLDKVREALGDKPAEELKKMAELGRAFLDSLGYKPPARSMPSGLTQQHDGSFAKVADGAAALVQPFTTREGGQPPLAGAVVHPPEPKKDKKSRK